MKTHDLIQGSPDWLAYRARHFNASDAPAMMGCSPYKTRAELLREMHTGVIGDVDIATQKRFDNGHRAESLARPLAEQIVGEPLYPVTGSVQVPGIQRGLSASFDGLTLADDPGFEHKALAEPIRAAFRAMAQEFPTAEQMDNSMAACRLLPIYHRVQMEQQCMVSGCSRILFMASEWTAEGELVAEHHVWYYPDHDLRDQIVDGWAQFEKDLAAYTLPDPKPEPARAEPMESLPAVSVRLDGALSVVGNLPSFAVALREFVAKIPQKPSTDTEFATCDAACKALRKAEEALDAAEAGALASITDVDAMCRAVADCRKLARDTRLAAEKMVERRKLEIKEQAVMTARQALDRHIAELNAELAPMSVSVDRVDFAAAIKGLRSFDSMQAALDTAVAGGKIAADGYARTVRANVAAFKAATGDDTALQALFADLGTIVHKAADDFATLVGARIATHRAAEAAKEAKRQADEAARIAAAEARARADEAARIEREQADKAAAEQRELARAEERLAALVAYQPAPVAPTPAPAPIAAPAPAPGLQSIPVADVAALQQRILPAAPAPTPRADEPATLRLGDICGRLGFTVSAAFLADALHIKPARTDGRAALFTEGQYQTLCRQLIAHVGAMAELYATEGATA